MGGNFVQFERSASNKMETRNFRRKSNWRGRGPAFVFTQRGKIRCATVKTSQVFPVQQNVVEFF